MILEPCYWDSKRHVTPLFWPRISDLPSVTLNLRVPCPPCSSVPPLGCVAPSPSAVAHLRILSPGGELRLFLFLFFSLLFIKPHPRLFCLRFCIASSTYGQTSFCLGQRAKSSHHFTDIRSRAKGSGSLSLLLIITTHSPVHTRHIVTMVLKGNEVAEHNNAKSCWVIVHVRNPLVLLSLLDLSTNPLRQGKAYDVTEFLPGTIRLASRRRHEFG